MTLQELSASYGELNLHFWRALVPGGEESLLVIAFAPKCEVTSVGLVLIEVICGFQSYRLTPSEVKNHFQL